MKTINVFIAGAKDLKSYREKLKVLAMDLNNNFYKSKQKFHLSIASYENFRNNQSEYDNYIYNKADLVIFILDGKIGEYTKDEYLLAVKSKREKGRPEVVVFLKSYKELTSDISYINGLLIDEDYYICYDNEDDLKHKVQAYILDTYIPKHTSRNKFSVSKNKSWIIGITTILLLSIGILFYWWSQSPMLLIAGGGSARNYIDQYYSVELDKYKKSYYVHMPSSNAWLLLTEEVISPQVNPKYYPLCVSASTAKEEDFLKITTRDNFLKVGSVIEMLLGYDTLAVFIKNDPSVIQMLDPDSFTRKDISTDRLADLVTSHNKLNVFATSPGSGTRNIYENLLLKKQIELTDHCFNQFSEYSDLPSINKNNLPYLLLGSKCYVMSDLRGIISSNGALNLSVYEEIDGEKMYIRKPINLYFMAYKHDQTNTLTIPQITLDFLKELGCNLGNKVEDNMVKRYTTDSVILQFDKLPNW